jgi:hypothetical protein
MVVWTTPYVIASLPTDFNFAQESIAGVAPDSYRDRRWFFPAPSEILGFSLGNGCHLCSIRGEYLEEASLFRMSPEITNSPERAPYQSEGCSPSF